MSERLEELLAEQNELLGGIFVQLSRILDTLYVMSGEQNSSRLDTLHRAGGILSSEPLLIIPEGEEDA